MILKTKARYFSLTLVNGLFLGSSYLVTFGMNGQGVVVKYIASHFVACLLIIWATQTAHETASAPKSN